MKEIKVRITFTEPILGTSPANPDVYREFIGSKSPEALSVEDEVAALGADAVAEKAMTVFPRTEDGPPVPLRLPNQGILQGYLRRSPQGQGHGQREDQGLQEGDRQADLPGASRDPAGV